MSENNLAMRRRRRIINVGDLDKRVKLQTRTLRSTFEVSNTHDDTELFDTVAVVRASIITGRGLTTFDGVELKASYSHVITIRYRKDLDDHYFIEYRGKRYSIVDYDDLDERHEFIKIKAKQLGTNEVDNEGAWG